ncbi:MAG TPA: hypothetical protein VMO26_18395 [Vicinamibacterales bacterium]|nr:hypothetical protein [Vicinamibacterales bacterium]
MDKEKAQWAVFLLFVAGLTMLLTREPWQPGQLTTMSGAVADYEVKRRAKGRSCYIIRLSTSPDVFRLCSISYSHFDRSAFEQDMRKSEQLQLLVVNEHNADKGTGEKVYRVQDVRTPAGRVYLDLANVQRSLARERLIGNILSPLLLAAALVMGGLATLRRWGSGNDTDGMS